MRLLFLLPRSEDILDSIDRAGMLHKLDKVILFTIALLVTLAVLLSPLGMVGLLMSLMLTFIPVYLYISRHIRKRKQIFLGMLPDALDIIVRSVRAGYPINSAIGMVADSLPADVGMEYLRITHEASLWLYVR